MKKTILLSSLLFTLCVVAQSQTNYYVTPEGRSENSGLEWSSPKDLSSALSSAVDGDVFHLASGVYMPTLLPLAPGNSIALDEKDFAFDVHKNVTIIGGYPADPVVGDVAVFEKNRTILKAANGAYRVMVVPANKSADVNAKVVLKGLTITGGAAHGSTAPKFSNKTMGRYYGGAIFCNGSRVDIDKCYFIDNKQNMGGAVFMINTIARINNSEISNNVATAGMGGGMSVQLATDIVLDNCLIDGNSASNGGGVFATNMDKGACLTLNNCVVSNNIAAGGSGGLYAYSGTTANKTANMVVNNCRITGNKTDAGIGAGINAAGSNPADVKNATNATMYVYNSLIDANEAGYKATAQGGGAIASRVRAAVHAVNCTMVGNKGKCVVYSDGVGNECNIISCTIVDNIFDDKKGNLGAVNGGPNANLNIYNTLVASNMYEGELIGITGNIGLKNNVIENDKLFGSDGTIVADVVFDREKMLDLVLTEKEGKQGYFKLIEKDDNNLTFSNPALNQGMTSTALKALATTSNAIEASQLGVDQLGISRAKWTIGAATVDSNSGLANNIVGEVSNAYTHNGILFVNAQAAAQVHICNIAGQLVRSENVTSGWCMINGLKEAKYIVSFEGKSYIVSF